MLASNFEDEMEKPKDERRAIGGLARAKSLTARERSEMAKKAASARWNSGLPEAMNEGEFRIGENSITCAVLPNEQRLISQGAFLKALGRARTLRAGTGIHSTVGELPVFLQSEVLKPFITAEIAVSATPIFYRTKDGQKAVGYDARLLPQVAELFLRFRDEHSRVGDHVPKRYEATIRAADIIMRGLASVGIIALVDEATGFQRERALDALQKILEKFVAKELQAYVKTFPEQFYEQLFRLRGLEYPNDTVKKPQYFGHLTNDIIYTRLAPGVLKELKRKTERDAKGHLKTHLHRQLTQEVGHPKLLEHLAAVVALMKVSPSYDQFVTFLDVAHPKYNTTMLLPFEANGL